MSFDNLTTTLDAHQRQPQQPTIPYTQFQQVCDEDVNNIKDYINNVLIFQLNSAISLLSGTERLGAGPIDGVPGSTAYAQLVSLKSQLDGIVAGMVPPGTPGYYLRTNLAGTDVEWSDIESVINATTSALTLAVTNNRIAIDELLAYNGVTSSVDQSDNVFYDFPESTKQLTAGTIDRANIFCETVNTGTDNVTMTSILSGKDGEAETDLTLLFNAGEEVTLQNDSIREVLTVSAVTATTITFTTSITGTYSSGANLYRSNLNVDNDVYKFGGFSSQTQIDRTTQVEVVAKPNDLISNGGRKTTRLSNGWIVTASLDSTTPQIDVHVSKDDGATFQRLCYVSEVAGFVALDFALESTGNIVHLLRSFPNGSNSGANIYNFDATTQSDVALTGAVVVQGGNQSSMGGCSLAIAPNGDLHACWTSKNASYPNSFNIRHSKSTDGGANWATVTQITTLNSSGFDFNNPSLVLNSIGNPVTIQQYVGGGSSYYITSCVYNGSAWVVESGRGYTVYNGATYTQSNPSADVLSDGTIVVAWEGEDSTDSTKFNIRYSQSVNNGANWSAVEKLTSGIVNQNRVPSITHDNNDIVSIGFLEYTGGDILLIQGNSFAWNVVETISSGVISGVGGVSLCNNFNAFEKPLTIFMNGVSSSVDFYGKWTEGTTTDTTETDIRLNIESWENVDSIASWLYSNNTANIIVDASLSVRADGANESYTDLADIEVAIDADNNYYVASGATATPEKLSTLKYHMTRALTTDDVEIKRVQGAVA